MPRKCTVCIHPNREEIDQALVAGESFRNIAECFSVSTTALFRHNADHLPALLVRAAKVDEMVRADDLLTQLRELRAKALEILDQAETAGDLSVALKAISTARGIIELLARLLGDIQEQSQTVNILVASPQWLVLRTTILRALESYPQARVALVDALAQVDLDEKVSPGALQLIQGATHRNLSIE